MQDRDSDMKSISAQTRQVDEWNGDSFQRMVNDDKSNDSAHDFDEFVLGLVIGPAVI